jgi:hypothetical protein
MKKINQPRQPIPAPRPPTPAPRSIVKPLKHVHFNENISEINYLKDEPISLSTEKKEDLKLDNRSVFYVELPTLTRERPKCVYGNSKADNGRAKFSREAVGDPFVNGKGFNSLKEVQEFTGEYF